VATMTKARRSLALSAAVVASLLAAAACGGGGGGSNQSSSGGSITMLVSGYMFDSSQFMNQYSAQITKEWDAKYPKIKLQVIKIAGTDVDEADALALRFKQASTTPDVVVTETPYLSEYAAAGYLLPLDKYLSSASSAPFWSTFSPNIKNLTKYNGTEYGVSAGNNDQGLLYNKKMLQQAGVPVPWNPKNWADILSAAQKVKAHDPGVIPIWLGAGVQAGPFNVGQGVANLLFGTSTPTMYDQSSKKWVVNSPGLTSSLNFYKEVYSQGLGAPTSQLFTTQAIGSPVNLMKQQKLAITLASNWMPEAWVTPHTSFYWPQSKTAVGIAPIPTEFGQAPGQAGEISGWALGVSKASGNPTAAWNLVKMNLETTNQLDMALWSGFVPPSPAVANLPQNLNFAAPFQAAFNSYLQYGAALPANENFTVYARGLNEATGTIAQTPSTSLSTILSSLSSSVSQQLGPQAVETKK
jgi:multiple sugar transport system substrate-binding protein